MKFEFDLILGSFLTFWSILGVRVGFKKCFGSTHVVEQLLFSMFSSFLTFDFDLNLGSFSTFWGPNGLFFELWWGWKTVLGSTHVVENLSFSMFPSILIFDFGLILRPISYVYN